MRTWTVVPNMWHDVGGAAQQPHGSGREVGCQDQPEDNTMDEVSIEDLDWDAIENGEQKRLHARVNSEAHVVGGLHKETSVGNVSLAGPKIIRGPVTARRQLKRR
jgi:hypothetical protein